MNIRIFISESEFRDFCYYLYNLMPPRYKREEEPDDIWTNLVCKVLETELGQTLDDNNWKDVTKKLFTDFRNNWIQQHKHITTSLED